MAIDLLVPFPSVISVYWRCYKKSYFVSLHESETARNSILFSLSTTSRIHDEVIGKLRITPLPSHTILHDDNSWYFLLLRIVMDDIKWSHTGGYSNTLFLTALIFPFVIFPIALMRFWTGKYVAKRWFLDDRVFLYFFVTSNAYWILGLALVAFVCLHQHNVYLGNCQVSRD